MATSILIAEDQTEVAIDLERRLGGLGYLVAGKVSTSEDAIAQMVSLHPDLLLMDIKLRGASDGQARVGGIRARFDLPIVYLAGQVDSAMLAEAKASDHADYVLEPFAKAERDLFEDSVGRAVEALRSWLTQGIDAAMRRANHLPSSPGGLDPD